MVKMTCNIVMYVTKTKTQCTLHRDDMFPVCIHRDGQNDMHIVMCLTKTKTQYTHNTHTTQGWHVVRVLCHGQTPRPPSSLTTKSLCFKLKIPDPGMQNHHCITWFWSNYVLILVSYPTLVVHVWEILPFSVVHACIRIDTPLWILMECVHAALFWDKSILSSHIIPQFTNLHSSGMDHT